MPLSQQEVTHPMKGNRRSLWWSLSCWSIPAAFAGIPLGAFAWHLCAATGGTAFECRNFGGGYDIVRVGMPFGYALLGGGIVAGLTGAVARGVMFQPGRFVTRLLLTLLLVLIGFTLLLTLGWS